MKARILRAQLLTTELRDQIEQLASELSGPAAAIFLDRLARLEAFPAEVLKQADIAPTVDAACRARDREASTLGRACASTLDLSQLYERGERIVVAGGGESLEWAMEVGLVAGVTAWLPEDGQRLGEELLERAGALVLSSPETFVGAYPYVTDRRAYEFPARMKHRHLQAWLSDLESAEEMVTAEADTSQIDVDLLAQQVSAADGSMLERLRRRFGPDARFEPAHLRGALAQLSDGPSRRPSHRERATSAMRAVSAGMRLAADSGSKLPPHALLCRHAKGELLVVRREAPVLEWYGDVGARVLHNGEELLPEKFESTGLRWIIPTAALGALELRVGPDTLSVDLPELGASTSASPFLTDIELVQAMIPFSPAACRQEFERIAASPTATVLERRAARAIGAGIAPQPFDLIPAEACLFPVVSSSESERWLQGGVCAASSGERIPIGAGPARDALAADESARVLVETLERSAGCRLAISPSLELDAPGWIELQGT